MHVCACSTSQYKPEVLQVHQMVLTVTVSFLGLFSFFYMQLTMTAKQTVLEEFRAAYSTSHWEDALKAVGSEYSYNILGYTEDAVSYC